jgi:cyclase
MDTIRIMPCLDMRAGRIVKGVRFVDLQEIGDPVANALFYEQEGADELALLDITATTENRSTQLAWVRQVSAALRIPLTVGGGIASLREIEEVLAAGAARISMNSAAIKQPDLVRQASAAFGADKITVALDARRHPGMPSGFELVIGGGQQALGRDALAWAQQCQDLGAGALLPTSMDGDGTRAGYDLDLIRAITARVSLPVVASGGAGTLEHFLAAARAGARILLAASVFHFRTLSIRQVKAYLRQHGQPVA